LRKPSTPNLSSGLPADDAVPDAPMSVTASNVTSLIMGLEARSLNSSSTANLHEDMSSTFNRGRRGRDSPPRNQYRDANSSRSPMPPRSPHRDRWPDDRRSDRATSPNSVRSGRPLASSASSVASTNWRSSMSTTSSASMSSSAFTRYSNSSVRSVSTAATSVSSNSWRNHSSHPAGLPKNVKMMDGVPLELTELPRGQRLEPDYHGAAPRKQRSRKPKELSLGTICERPAHSAIPHQKSPGYIGRDASASNADLNSALSSTSSQDGDGPKKVQKGQINALAKMLSALRR